MRQRAAPWGARRGSSGIGRVCMRQRTATWGAMLAGLAALLFGLAAPAAAQVHPFPPGFRTQAIATNGTTLHVRTGGLATGPAVVLLHGFGETGAMWGALAADLARDHRVIVPDLRGMGLSAHPAGGYDKKNQAADLAGVLDAL